MTSSSELFISLLYKTSVTHSAAPRVPLFLFLPHFDVICDLLTDARQLGIYLLIDISLYESLNTNVCLNLINIALTSFSRSLMQVINSHFFLSDLWPARFIVRSLIQVHNLQRGPRTKRYVHD